MERRDGGLSVVRALNEQLVLETLLREGAVSRARLARLTGLSKPTVSSVVQGLEDCALVRPQGRHRGNTGRPSTLYEVNPRAGYVLGVDLGGTNVRAGIADLYGDVVAEETEATVFGSGQAIVDQVASLHQRLLGRAGLDAELVRVAAVGVPGIFDPGSDRVSAAANLPGLAGLAVSETLGRALGVPVQIDNDVNLAAVGERWRGLGLKPENVVVVSIGTGIGMGIIIGGEIYRGSGAAGEIDFLPIGADPFVHDQGHGPLELSVAGPALVERLRRRIQAGDETQLRASEDPAEIFAAAACGDLVAAELVEEEARMVALAVAAVAAVLDPELVVLGGGVGSNPGLLEPVRRNLAAIFPRPVDVRTSTLGDRAGFHGALAVALRAARQELLAEVAARR